MPVQRKNPASQDFRGRLKRLILLSMVLVFGIISLWYVRQRPHWMFDDARKLVPSNPAAAERMLESAVGANGGSFPKAQFLRCQLLAQLGKWDEALGGFSQIKDFSELPAPELARLADRAAGNGVPLLAELALDAARRPGPSLANVLRQSIRFHLDHGRTDRALDECNELIEIAPEDPVAWQVRGSLHLDRKQIKEAETDFREAIRRGTTTDQTRSVRELLIRVLLDGGRADDARKELSLLAAEAPLTNEARLMDAYICRLEGKWDRAIETVDALAENAPELGMRSRMLRGMLWLDQGEPAKAVPDLEKVVAEQPYNKEAHSKLAQAYRKLNQPNKSRTHALEAQRLTELANELLTQEESLARDPANEVIRRRTIELYLALGQPEKATRLRSGLSFVRSTAPSERK